MGKNKKQSISDEAHLLLPAYAINTGIVDTHTHLVFTFAQYQSKYKRGTYETIYDFTVWRELADSALKKDEPWNGTEYWFVIGVHPREAKLYTDATEKDMFVFRLSFRCVGWGKIGLDYHYDNSPRDIQQSIFYLEADEDGVEGSQKCLSTRHWHPFPPPPLYSGTALKQSAQSLDILCSGHEFDVDFIADEVILTALKFNVKLEDTMAGNI
ncbi:hypothetical protein PILCRDRAFT_14994 [Piloderma croceum F 1598]|uniref:Uncharacterized protein n=1 Tax=Piloderma croceum (strain F 1598) TaxID=765440 RepID=A0A0C3AIW5_PILCF|nr:hypothetical protein PILCRDRAFT_14994 [Piloderma croceum F 1598]